MTTKRTRAYTAWLGMRTRCRNPRAPGYRYIGAKGITFCERWNSFANFLADLGEPPPNTALLRDDPNGDYSPENARWANHRTSRTARGEAIHNAKLTAAQALAIHGLRGREHQTVTAQRFGVTSVTVSMIQTGKTWRHVTGAERLPPICRRPRRNKGDQ